MRRQQVFFTLIVAVMAVLTAGCQKDEEYVTLVAEIQERMSGNGKVYIDEHTPCWQNGDEVFINNAVYCPYLPSHLSRWHCVRKQPKQ